MEAFRRTRALVNLNHLVENAKKLRAQSSTQSFFCPMIKADAYGHGSIFVAQALEAAGFHRVGVSLIEEAIEIRDFGFRGEILVFGSFDSGVPEILNYGLTPIVSHMGQIDLLNSQVNGHCDVHLKFETGMGRLGFEPAQAELLKSKIDASKKIRVKGLLSHLHSGHDLTACEQQISHLRPAANVFSAPDLQVHLWNSSGLAKSASHSSASHWGSRPGISLYGGWDHKPTLSFRSQVVQIHKVPRGASVSYGATWIADEPTWVGTVSCGYADGYPRHLSNKGQVLICGQRVPVIGAVCMDYFMVNLNPLTQHHPDKSLVGEEVTLFGWDDAGNILSVDEVANTAQTISYELMTNISQRVPRTYISEQVIP